MKKRDLNDLKAKSLNDLKKVLGDLQKEKTEKAIELELNKLKNVHAKNLVRKNIAQVKTFITLKKMTQKLEQEKEAKSGEI